MVNALSRKQLSYEWPLLGQADVKPFDSFKRKGQVIKPFDIPIRDGAIN